MYIELNPSLLAFLMCHGYRYCLSGTMEDRNSLERIVITLKPVQHPPLAVTLPDGFDNYFLTREEPALLANGIDGVLVRVEVDLFIAIFYLGTTPQLKAGSEDHK